MDAREENIRAWRSVAAGWERRRELIRTATQPVSERLVELLGPERGETILELGAGPGDTGFLALPHLMPGGRLVTSDVAPEMVEVARRRAAELGVNDVAFAVEDAASLSFEDSSFDGILWRWGPMLVPDMDAAIDEVHRVLRPGGRAAIAVWASPAANEWMTASGRAALELGLAEPPDRDAPGPFRLAGDGLLQEALEHGGLDVEVVEDVAMTWEAPSLDDWWSISCDMSRMLALLAERLTPDDLTAVRGRAEELLAGYVRPDGTLAVPSLARVALATR